METSKEKLLDDFEVGWNHLERAVSVSNESSIEMLLSVLRRKLDTDVEFLYAYPNFAVLRIDLSEVKIRASDRSLVCFTRIDQNTYTSTSEAYRLLTTAHYADSPAGYCTIAIVCGVSQELKKRCRDSSLDLVVLDRDQLRKIIAANSWSDSLAEVLREEQEPDILSPYDEIGICSPEMFFGRQREIRRLTSHAKGHGYSLVGCRRIGKSSLLLQLKRYYDQIGEPTYYIDCQTCHSTSAFYDEIVKRTNRRDYKSRRQWTLKGYLIRLASRDTKPLNLFLDEVDQVVSYDAKLEYQYIIRELFSAESTQKIPFRVWIAGFKELYWAALYRTKSYNQL